MVWQALATQDQMANCPQTLTEKLETVDKNAMYSLHGIRQQPNSPIPTWTMEPELPALLLLAVATVPKWPNDESTEQ